MHNITERWGVICDFEFNATYAQQIVASLQHRNNNINSLELEELTDDPWCEFILDRLAPVAGLKKLMIFFELLEKKVARSNAFW